MRHAALCFGAWFALIAWAGAAAQENAGDVGSPGTETLIDEGLLLIDGGPGRARTEDFSVFRRPDGGYTVLNATGSNSYTTVWNLNYDRAWRLLNGKGQGTTKGVTRVVEVTRESGDIVRISRRATGKGVSSRTVYFTAACDRDCLVDMAPGATPASVMPNRYDRAKGGEQKFKWVRVSLISDEVFLDGSATLALKGEQTINGGSFTVASHWLMREELTETASGKTETLQGHLWTDPKGWLRKFAVGPSPQPSMAGIRSTDEKFSKQMIAD